MKKPKFIDGDIVYNWRLNKNGIILHCINTNEKKDIKAQGFRYYVKFGYNTWSMPESSLIKKGE